MRKSTTLVLLAGASAMLAGCGSSGGILGRERPDEFAVQRQAPLVVPPDFSLVPPAPGAPRPTEDAASEEALEVLFGTEVGDPATHTVAKGRVTRDIVAAPEGDGQFAQAVIPAG